jgi:serine/threonine protein kinase
MKFEPGQKIGGYRIVRLLGEGGMGAVYEVEHERLGVRYALKIFTSQCAYADILQKKFLAEGKVLARLRHPNLIRVFDLDVDESTGVPYFVMDIVMYKDGFPHTLCDIELSDLEEDYILGWFEDLCNSLDYIHGQGIVHRDIKLGNVLLNKDKHVILSDFGVLRIFGEDLATELDVTKTFISDGKTESKLVMGTNGYMAPEVQSGYDATPASDVYSLGVMFFHLLTGLWYEPGSKALSLLDSFKYRWNEVLPRMLCEDPAQRPLPLSDLLRLLRLSGPSVAEAQEAPKRSKFSGRKRIAVAIFCAIVAVAVALSLFLLFWTGSNGVASAADDDFDELFSSSGLSQSTGDGK